MKEMNINIKIDEMGYNKEEQRYLLNVMGIMALVGANCPISNNEELKAWCDETLANEKARVEKEEEKKRRKAEREKEKAEAEGLSVEEYRKAKNHKAHVKRVENEIAKLEKELARKKDYLKKLKNNA